MPRVYKLANLGKKGIAIFKKVIVTTANRNFDIPEKSRQTAFQYFKNSAILMLWTVKSYTYDGRCPYLLEKVSWPSGTSTYENMEFHRLLVLEIKDRGEEAAGIHR